MKGIILTFATISILAGVNLFLTQDANAVMLPPKISGIEDHQHPHIDNTQIENAEDLVASKNKSDMTYKQIMQRMGEAYNMMQRGIINQNKELIRHGAWMIDNHPAPKEKPWFIVKKEDQKAFKLTLLSYNDLLHDGSYHINIALKQNDWEKINQEVYNLSHHCISCHSMWKNQTIK